MDSQSSELRKNRPWAQWRSEGPLTKEQRKYPDTDKPNKDLIRSREKIVLVEIRANKRKGGEKKSNAAWRERIEHSMK